MDENNERSNDGQWVSILGVPPERVRPHFWAFSACFVVTLIFYGYVHVVDADNPSWRSAPTSIMGDTTRAAAFWVVSSPIVVEGVAMVFAALYREKKRREARQEGREEGREEGRAETNAAWDEWNQRRIQAEATGEPFAEPPPSAANGSIVG